MNNFAKIKHIGSFELVEYYSICLEEDGDWSLFEQFINKHELENKAKLNHILSWIKWIGNRYGAKSDYFRNEAETADTSALPPKNPNWEPTYIEWNNEEQSGETNNLRLYTFRANNHVVFLFNGDVKTTDKAQNCPNVQQHFKLANKLTQLIEQHFRIREIRWNDEQTDIDFDEDLELIW